MLAFAGATAMAQPPKLVPTNEATETFGTHSRMVTTQRIGALRSMPRQFDASQAFTKSGAPTRLNAAQGGPTIYGSMIYSDTWNISSTNYGVYSFTPTNPLEFSMVKASSSLNANAGGVYIDGKFYFVSYFEVSGTIFPYYNIFDATTWDLLSSTKVDMTSVATDLTYDPVGEKIYGCFINSSGNGYVFGRMSQATGEVYGIANLDGPLFFVAADANGDIYGVTVNGYLHKIDKTTGRFTTIGFTGLYPINSQTATFDYATNTLYWAACTENAWGLYTVDTTTGAATLVAPFENREEFGGLFITNQTAAAKAPGEITDFNIEYVVGTTANVKVSFTMPKTHFDGTAMSGKLDYVVSLNDVDVDITEATAGEKVEFTLQHNSPGMTSVSVYAKNSAGKGPYVRDRKWMGIDIPEDVTNLKATPEGDKVYITWDAPTKGKNGGYFNPAQLAYRVVRQPGDVVLANRQTATSYIDNIDGTDLSSRYYEVTVYQGNTMGGTVATEKLLTGNAMDLPYKETFEKESDFQLFTVIDANNDKSTWVYDTQMAKGKYSMYQDMDDWLITPPIKLSASTLNELRFKVRTLNYLERFEVYLGTSNTVEGMTTELLAPVETRVTSFETYKVPVLVPTDGVYYIGFHHISDKGKYNLYLDDIELAAASEVGAPGAVTNLQAVAGPKGECSATISFNAPSTNIIGGQLNQITKINVFRGAKIIGSISNPTPGKAYSVADNDPEMEFNLYRVVPVNSVGTGTEATVTVFVGPDLPDLPTNIRLREENGKAVLTWEPPVGGANGGYIDRDNLLYHLCTFEQGTLTWLIKNLTECRYVEEPPLPNGQDAISYVVFAESEKGIGLGDISNIVVMGTPYELPFKESFSDGYTHYSTWGFANDNDDDESQWGLEAFGTLPTCQPQDADNGLLSFYPGVEHSKSWLYSGKIDMKGTQNPVAEFYYYYKRKATDVIEFQISTNGIDFNTVETIKMAELDTNTGWKLVRVPLTQFKNNDFVQIAFRVEAGDDITALHFDNINVRDVKDYDLAATHLELPAKFGVGREATFTATVANVGSLTASAYEVALFRDGKQVATVNGSNLAPDEEKTYTFKQTPHQNFGEQSVYYAQVFFAKDQQPANDKTAAKTIEVTHPNYPTVNDLTGTLDAESGTATLNWSAPGMNFDRTVVESFEKYDAFSVNNVGDWGMLDNDRGETIYINGMSWSHIGEAQAYIVFNTKKAGASKEFSARTGDQHLVAFASEYVKNDDWLFSPRLNGKAQTIKFWVKSITHYYGAETFEFYTTYYDFRDNIMDYMQDYNVGGEVPEEWTEVTVDIPEGTTYFAIRCTSNNAYGFCVDDIEFIPQSETELTFAGYDVYCNSEKLNDKPITTTTYTHPGVDPQGGYHYHVVCVFEQGESPASNVVGLGATMIESPSTGSVVVASEGGLITISGAEGQRYAIHTIDGRLLTSGTALEWTAFETNGGVYLVTVGQKSYKILVK